MSHIIDQVLRNLNSEQKKATEQIYGPVLVSAGPGTGKTQLLTARIAHILQSTDSLPSNILCLTFTESGAIAMRNRLAQWIGPTAYQIKIMTFHGFCEWVLQYKSEAFDDEIINFRLADSLEKIQILRSCIDQGHKILRPFGAPYLYEYEIGKHISDLKREAFTPQTFREILPKHKEKDLQNPSNFYLKDSKYGKKGEFKKGIAEKLENKYEKLIQLSHIWEALEKAKYKAQLYDFDDQISWVLQALKSNPTLKAELQEQFQFLLVDEYQDTNNAQNEILWHLTDYFDDPNIFVVGDGDQAVYRFQGAGVANMKDFLARFPSALQIQLTQNYRSAPFVLESAYALVGHNLERLNADVALTAAGPYKEIKSTIQKSVFNTRSSEIIYLADTIETLLKEGQKPSEITILVRENREAREIAEYLTKFKIPVNNQMAENIFESPEVEWLIALLRLRHNIESNDRLYQGLQMPFWDIPGAVLIDIQIQARAQKTSLLNVLRQYKSKDNHVAKILNWLSLSQKDYAHASSKIWLERVFHYSGMAQFLLKDPSPEGLMKLQKIKKFMEWIDQKEDQKATHLEILEYIQLHQELKVGLYPDPLPQEAQAVKIMTAHKSKGLEFEVVLLPGFTDKIWGNKRNFNKITLPDLVDEDPHDPNEEERRLAFVALSRAKSKIYISSSAQDFNGRERTASMFSYEIPEDCITNLETDSIETRAYELLPLYFQSPKAPLLTADEAKILKTLAQKFIWSATSLQNYLDCPRKFLYLNLLKIPTPPQKIMGYGSAIHEALESFLQHYGTTKKTDPNYAFEVFEEALKKQNLPLKDYQESLKHGLEILKNYLKTQIPDLAQTQNWKLELGLRTDIENIPVFGKIDKVEINPETKNGLLVDYKSGKPKSIKPGDRFWRQLVFYDLLAQNTKNLNWKPCGMALEFLTPDPKGQLIKTAFQASDEDREQVLQELKIAHQSLQNLAFPNKENPQNDPEIDYWQHFGQ